MPNWCSNFVEVGHEDPTKITALAEAFNRGEFCDHVIPVPEDLKIVAGSVGDPVAQAELERKTAENREKYGAGNWYDFCTSRWGTKWDVGGDGQSDIHPDGTLMTASFDSAWSPPMGVYDALVEQGYTVRAYYYESGMCFAGIYDNGSDDCYSDWGDSQGAKDTLPAELDDFFAISESQAEYEEENRMDEELYRFVKEGEEKRNLELKTQ
jgi:YHS domain-containing protein